MSQKDIMLFKVTTTGIRIYTPYKTNCWAPYLEFNDQLSSNFAEALTFWLSIYSIPSFTMRLPYSDL